MTKGHRMFTLDVELLEKLKRVNASALVNKLLKDYFDKEELKGKSQEEIDAILDLMKKKDEITTKLEDLYYA